MAFPSTILSRTAASASEFLGGMFGGFGHVEGHNEIITEVAATQSKVGLGATTPDAAYKTLMGLSAGTTSWDYHLPVTLPAVSGTGSSGVLEISSIPATFWTMEIEIAGGRSSAAATTVDTVRLTFETSPTAGAYNHQRMFGAAAVVSADENIGASSFINVGTVPAVNSEADFSAPIIIRIPGYSATTFKKAGIGDAASFLDDASGGIFRFSNVGNYESNSAIDRVRLTLASGNWLSTVRMRVRLYP